MKDSNTDNTAKIEEEKQPVICKCCSLKIVSPFATITTNVVLKRICLSLFPIKTDFLDSLENKPDIYGPFWIYATLIFCLAAAGNLSKYIETSATFVYDFSYLPVAFFLVFALGFSIPILMYCIFRIFGVVTQMMECVCIYGYSMFIFIPISFICIIDNDMVKWGLMIYGALSTIVFIIVNFWPRFKPVATKNKYTIITLIVIMQLILFFLFKYYFFQSIYTTSTTTSATTIIVVNAGSTTAASSSANSANSTTNAIQLIEYMFRLYRIEK